MNVNQSECDDKDKYFKRLLINCETEEEKKIFIKEAYIVALDTRKFEIELYWKRATYFWAFIVAIFAAYFSSLKDNPDLYQNIISCVIVIMGCFFSFGWHLVARGSKVWQENWEMHIRYLEEEVHGPLFKIFSIPNLENKYFSATKEYPYSVSKVNQILSLYTFYFWIVLFIFSLLKLFPKQKLECLRSCLDINKTQVVIIFIFILIYILYRGLFLIAKRTGSFHVDLLKDNDVVKVGKWFYYYEKDKVSSIFGNKKSCLKSFFMRFKFRE